MSALMPELQAIPVTAWLVILGCVIVLGVYAYVSKGDGDG